MPVDVEDLPEMPEATDHIFASGKWWKVNPKAENVHNLPPGYYDKQIEDMSGKVNTLLADIAKTNIEITKREGGPNDDPAVVFTLANLGAEKPKAAKPKTTTTAKPKASKRLSPAPATK